MNQHMLQCLCIYENNDVNYKQTLAAVTLELKKWAKQTNMLEPRLHES